MSSEKLEVSDERYRSYMETENADWRRDYVKERDFSSYDGLSLRCYHACQPEGKAVQGSLVMLHGYCGFWGKFHEMAHLYWQAGYEVFFLEHRGHGYSGRQTDDKDMVHVRDYGDYVRDLKVFMDEVVCPAGPQPRILFGHSMGGAVAALFLEEYPGYFQKAVLSSPMFSIKTGKIPGIAVWLMRAKVRLLHQEEEPFAGGSRFDGVPVFETSSARSRARYDYIFKQRLADYHYQTYMPSNGWSCASFRAVTRLIRNADKVQIPVLLLSAGNDSLVDPSGYDRFAARAGQVRRVHFREAKHELYNDLDEVRGGYYREILDFLGEGRDAAVGTQGQAK